MEDKFYLILWPLISHLPYSQKLDVEPSLKAATTGRCLPSFHMLQVLSQLTLVMQMVLVLGGN